MRLLLFSLLVLCVCSCRSMYQERFICKIASCSCASNSHPFWVTVNCTVPPEQRLIIHDYDMPNTTSDLFVTGGNALIIDSNALTPLSDVRQIFLHRIKEITIKKWTAVGLSTISLYVEIDQCEILNIQEQAFTKIKGPLSITIKNCDKVYIEGEALSWLLMVNITNVGELQLKDGSFTLDPTAGNVGEHGPGMSINLNNVRVPEIPAHAFGSSAASIIMQAINVGTIRQGAFSANTYNIVMALNCSIKHIEEEAFAQKSLINSLYVYGCSIHELAAEAMRSAVAKMNITSTKFNVINKGAINATVGAVTIIDNEFHVFMEKGFVLSSCNNIYMHRNKFDELSPNAISAPGGSVNELVFTENEVETAYPNSLGFVGSAYSMYPFHVIYDNNYYGSSCFCNITLWLAKSLGVSSAEPFIEQSYCTIDDFFAICFNVPEKNIKFDTFMKKVCTTKPTIQCEEVPSKKGETTEIRNPRFPHQKPENTGISERDRKVIGIVIVTAVGCVIIVMIISLIRWMRRRGYCLKLRNAANPCINSCTAICNVTNSCRRYAPDNARSMSHFSVVEYSEHQRLNEPRSPDPVPESSPIHFIELNTMNTNAARMIDKVTQTLPEELTRDLLENLKEKLDDPERYAEARELIEHLYDLIQFNENSNKNNQGDVENIYELPFQNTAPRVGKNKKQMKSIGTDAPSLEHLLPFSPTHRRAALANEYFEPKDYAVHLYSEIMNQEKDRKPMLGAIPDVVAEQGVPRGPYLRAVHEKLNTNDNKNKMSNRPLPQKPAPIDSGEGTSIQSN